MMFYKTITQIPFNKRIHFYLIALFVFVMVMFFSLSFNLKATYQKVKEEEQGLRISKFQKEGEIALLGELKKNIDKLDEQIQIVSLRLPSKRDVTSLLDSINELAQRTNLIMENYSAKPEKEFEGVIEIPMLFEFKGEFLQIQKFLTELGQLQRLINVKLINLRSDLSNNKGEQNLNVECLVTAYHIS